MMLGGLGNHVFKSSKSAYVSYVVLLLLVNIAIVLKLLTSLGPWRLSGLKAVQADATEFFKSRPHASLLKRKYLLDEGHKSTSIHRNYFIFSLKLIVSLTMAFKKDRIKPTPYPFLPFHAIRSAQFVSSLIVASIMFYFLRELNGSNYSLPWTFILVSHLLSFLPSALRPY